MLALVLALIGGRFSRRNLVIMAVVIILVMRLVMEVSTVLVMRVPA